MSEIHEKLQISLTLYTTKDEESEPQYQLNIYLKCSIPDLSFQKLEHLLKLLQALCKGIEEIKYR